MATLQQLQQKLTNQGLTPVETEHLRILTEAHHAASRDPEVIKLKQEHARINRGRVLEAIYAIRVDGDYLTRCEANERVLDEIFGQSLTPQVFKDTIKAEQKRRFIWSKPPISVRELEKQAREVFAAAAKQTEAFSQHEANFRLCVSVLRQGFDVNDVKDALFTGLLNGLTPPSQQEHDQWRAEKIAEYHKQLLAASPSELRAAVRDEAVTRQQQAQREHADQQLKVDQQREQHLNYPELPTHHNGVPVDANFFKKLKAEEFKVWIKRYGFYALNIRIREGIPTGESQ